MSKRRKTVEDVFLGIMGDEEKGGRRQKDER